MGRKLCFVSVIIGWMEKKWSLFTLHQFNASVFVHIVLPVKFNIHWSAIFFYFILGIGPVPGKLGIIVAFFLKMGIFWVTVIAFLKIIKYDYEIIATGTFAYKHQVQLYSTILTGFVSFETLQL